MHLRSSELIADIVDYTCVFPIMTCQTLRHDRRLSVRTEPSPDRAKAICDPLFFFVVVIVFFTFLHGNCIVAFMRIINCIQQLLCLISVFLEQ